MTFFYYEINTRRFIQSTNIRALEEFSGISYHKIWNWFTDGSNLHVDDSIICGCSDLVRGKQRLQNNRSIEKGITIKKVKIDHGQTGPEGPKERMVESLEYKIIDTSKLPVRETKQPGSRDMKGYDDFFKEVE